MFICGLSKDTADEAAGAGAMLLDLPAGVILQKAIENTGRFMGRGGDDPRGERGILVRETLCGAPRTARNSL
jgi:hypothetical protein